MHSRIYFCNPKHLIRIPTLSSSKEECVMQKVSVEGEGCPPICCTSCLTHFEMNLTVQFANRFPAPGQAKASNNWLAHKTLNNAFCPSQCLMMFVKEHPFHLRQSNFKWSWKTKKVLTKPLQRTEPWIRLRRLCEALIAKALWRGVALASHKKSPRLVSYCPNWLLGSLTSGFIASKEEAGEILFTFTFFLFFKLDYCILLRRRRNIVQKRIEKEFKKQLGNCFYRNPIVFLNMVRKHYNRPFIPRFDKQSFL